MTLELVACFLADSQLPLELIANIVKLLVSLLQFDLAGGQRLLACIQLLANFGQAIAEILTLFVTLATQVLKLRRTLLQLLTSFLEVLDGRLLFSRSMLQFGTSRRPIPFEVP